jgi:hypothetical protein
MPEATNLFVAVKNIETPDERHAFEHASLNVVNLPGPSSAPRSGVAVPGICCGPVLSTGRLKG